MKPNLPALVAVDPTSAVIRALSIGAVALLVAACSSSANSSGPTDGSVSADGAQMASPDVAPVDAAPDVAPVPIDAPYPAMHEPWPQVGDQGGTKLMHPRIVIITFADDPNRAAIEEYGQWIVGSDWLTTVGQEYGVGSGTIIENVELTTNAPDMILDSEIQTMLVASVQDHTIMEPSNNDYRNVLYMIYYPSHTTITLNENMQTSQSCDSFGGYHGEVRQAGFHFAYAVLPNCTQGQPGLSAFQSEENAASHELIEAATDAFPYSAPGLSFSQNDTTAWITLGGEVGDLCVGNSTPFFDGTHVAQRIWSDVAAAAGGDPCIPVDTSTTFYGTSASPSDIQFASPGDVVSFDLQGFSTAPTTPWQIQVFARGARGTRITTALSTQTMNNGLTGTLQITVPTTAQSGSLIRATLVSTSNSGRGISRTWPIVIEIQ